MINGGTKNYIRSPVQHVPRFDGTKKFILVVTDAHNRTLILSRLHPVHSLTPRFLKLLSYIFLCLGLPNRIFPSDVLYTVIKKSLCT
jgi:hypothetical protein